MLFNNGYSSIITKGLGGPACCTLIVAQFGLGSVCKVEVIIPPSEAIGSGGGIAVRGFHVPFPSPIKQNDRIVLITVKVSDNTFRKSYVLDVKKADIIVKISNIIDIMREKVNIGVGGINQLKRTVTAFFTKSNKYEH